MNGFMTMLYTLGLFFAFAAGSMLLQRQAAFLQSTTAKPTFPRATVLLSARL